MQNKMKINDWSAIQGLFDELIKRLDKARKVRQMIDARGLNVSLEIDGGVGPANILEVAKAGVDTFVAGSAVCGAAKDGDPHRYDSVIAALRSELAKA